MTVMSCVSLEDDYVRWQRTYGHGRKFSWPISR